ncbi:7SK snRNA methylphosphate capping enzyme [Echinococcus granulosus]|uniref:RNA methyltransferase n=1 Tax=Echinococcus granulosus TaxID=6210 RepID=A0A068WEE8_ECHGR|nr:7SK snRNA methylphosphate capping enzyme [Echinococcus granulosus]CDS16007.1 7sk snrna methylphosphate capping enzyme [Echinococcus granulosus]
MQRNRMRPQFWPGYNHVSALAEPRFPSPYRWRFHTPALSRPLFQNGWILRGPPRSYNYAFDPVPHQAPGRPVRRPISSQSRSSAFRSCKYYAKNRRRSHKTWKPALNPSDPLNLQDLMKETDRRRIEGLSPPHGDSRLNTPALSINGEPDGTSPNVSDPPNSILSQPSLNLNGKRSSLSFRCSGLCLRTSRRTRWQGRRMPLTGNYPDYYSRRDPDDRIKVLMPEWFSNSDVADYGCHNGTVTFKILEHFPDVNRIDAFDCDAELIENAKSLQREKIRWAAQTSANFEKINFQVADWSDCISTDDDPTYNIILAFSVTKWIHLNYGDAGLMRFFRRVFNLLKPGGHLLLEPQPKASYKNSRFTIKQQENYKAMTIDPSNLEPILLDIGFSYFDKIKVPRPNESFQRCIMLCSKSYGATPSSIRNDCREAAHLWRGSPILSDTFGAPAGPPPVRYCPQTPNYSSIVSPAVLDAYPTFESSGTTPNTIHLGDVLQSAIISSTVPFTNSDLTPGEATPPHPLDSEVGVANYSNISAPDSTSQN